MDDDKKKKPFKPNPKPGDTEQRAVLALHSHDEGTKETLKRIKERPPENLSETRVFQAGKWLDWKITP
jgi:hypothetical protein